MVKSYIEDADPEALLRVGADMRKINYCFQLLKVCHQHYFLSVTRAIFFSHLFYSPRKKESLFSSL